MAQVISRGSTVIKVMPFVLFSDVEWLRPVSCDCAEVARLNGLLTAIIVLVRIRPVEATCISFKTVNCVCLNTLI